MTDLAEVEKNMVLLRNAQGWTQEDGGLSIKTQNQLASLSHMSTVCLRGIEHGCTNMTVCKLLDIAGTFRVSLTELNICTIARGRIDGNNPHSQGQSGDQAGIDGK